MLKHSFGLALKNLRKRGLRTWLTLLGVVIGITAVVSFISLGEGLRNAVVGQFASLSADRLIVQSAETGFGPPGSTAIRKLTSKDSELIEETSGVELTLKRIIRSGKIEFNKQSSFALIGSIPDEKEKIDYLYESFNIKVAEGKLISAGDSGKVVLGNDYLERIDFGKTLRAGSRLKIQGKEFEVIGILDKLGSVFFNSIILMSEKDMNNLFNIGDESDIIVVKIESEEITGKVAKDLEDKLRRDRKQKKGEEDFSIQTPEKAFESVSLILNIINLIVSGIAGISLLVGGIGVANVMYASVLERTRDIGVMKAVGARNSDILYIFVIESCLLGLIGGIAGSFLGIGLAFLASASANAYFDNQILKVTFSLQLIIASVIFSLFIGLLAGVLPARQAAKLKPVEALRR